MCPAAPVPCIGSLHGQVVPPSTPQVAGVMQTANNMLLCKLCLFGAVPGGLGSAMMAHASPTLVARALDNSSRVCRVALP